MKGKVDIQEFYSVLDSLYEKKEMDKIEPYMLEVLSRAGNLEDLEGVVSVCNELGGLYRAMRRTDEALWTYEKVMEGLEQMGLKGTRNYASALINLGNVHIARKSYEKAYGIDRQALEILERLGGEAYQRAALYNNMSAALRELGRTKEAQDMALRAIEIIRELPECTGELATSYTLGNLDDVQGYYENAEERYIRAAKLIERDFGHTCDYDQIMEDLQRVRRKVKKVEGNGIIP